MLRLFITLCASLVLSTSFSQENLNAHQDSLSFCGTKANQSISARIDGASDPSLFLPPFAEGNIKIAIIKLDFADYQADDFNASLIPKMHSLKPYSLKPMVEHVSRGLLTVDSEYFYQELVYPGNLAAGCDTRAWQSFLAENLRSDILAGSSHIHVIIPNRISCQWSGFMDTPFRVGFRPYRNTFQVYSQREEDLVYVYVHEIGHTFGLGHSSDNNYDPLPNVFNRVRNFVNTYARYDYMGLTLTTLSLLQRVRAGWIFKGEANPVDFPLDRIPTISLSDQSKIVDAYVLDVNSSLADCPSDPSIDCSHAYRMPSLARPLQSYFISYRSSKVFNDMTLRDEYTNAVSLDKSIYPLLNGAVNRIISLQKNPSIAVNSDGAEEFDSKLWHPTDELDERINTADNNFSVKVLSVNDKYAKIRVKTEVASCIENAPTLTIGNEALLDEVHGHNNRRNYTVFVRNNDSFNCTRNIAVRLQLPQTITSLDGVEVQSNSLIFDLDNPNTSFVERQRSFDLEINALRQFVHLFPEDPELRIEIIGQGQGTNPLVLAQKNYTIKIDRSHVNSLRLVYAGSFMNPRPNSDLIGYAAVMEGDKIEIEARLDATAVEDLQICLKTIDIDIPYTQSSVSTYRTAKSRLDYIHYDQCKTIKAGQKSVFFEIQSLQDFNDYEGREEVLFQASVEEGKDVDYIFSQNLHAVGLFNTSSQVANADQLFLYPPRHSQNSSETQMRLDWKVEYGKSYQIVYSDDVSQLGRSANWQTLYTQSPFIYSPNSSNPDEYIQNFVGILDPDMSAQRVYRLLIDP